MRRTGAMAARNVISRSTQMACTSHRPGARRTRSSDVALMPPDASATRANRAGCFHPGWRRDRTVNATSHGSAVNGSRITECL